MKVGDELWLVLLLTTIAAYIHRFLADPTLEKTFQIIVDFFLQELQLDWVSEQEIR